MSSNCPQLQLSLQSSTTSFKRSFEQFGFDLESPEGSTDAGGSGRSNGNDRNKRARSASSFSEGSDSMDSSHLSSVTSGSSGSSLSRDGDTTANDSTSSPIVALGASLSTHGALEPPRIPTPDIQDIEMPDYPADGHNSESFADSLTPQVPDLEDRYRYPFHNALRHPQSNSSLIPRSPTSPPVLPPLYISEDQSPLSTSPIPFLHPSPQYSATSHADTYFDNQSMHAQGPTTNSHIEEHEQDHPLFQNEFQSTRDPLAFSVPSNRLQSLSNNVSGSRSDRRVVPSSHTSNPTHFRDHLNSALDLLRSSSPLVPDFENAEQEASLPHSHVNTRIPRVLPNPPTLPPIVTHTDNDHWNQSSASDVFTPPVPSASSFNSPTTHIDSSISNSDLNLVDHPLPSPGLHDLHNWMDASSSGSSHSWDASHIPASSVATDSRQDYFNVNGYHYQGMSSTVQSRPDRGYTASIPQQPLPTVLPSSPLRHRRLMRMSDLEGSRREWPSTSISTSASVSQSDSDSQSNPNPSPIGLAPLSFSRRSADEMAVRSLDQGFDSRFTARSSSYLDRFRVHEGQLAELTGIRGRGRASSANISELAGQMADEVDTGDRGLPNFQRNTTSRPTLSASNLERRSTSSDNFTGFFGRIVNDLDDGDNSSTGPPPTSQATTTSRYLDPDSPYLISTFPETRPSLGGNHFIRDIYLRHRLRTQITRPGASNSLVNESAAEARRRADRLEVLERMSEGREDRRNNSGSGTFEDSLDSHLRSLEADLRDGISSVGWASLNRRPVGPTNDSQAVENSQRHVSWREPPVVEHRSTYPSLPQPNIPPLHGISSNNDMDMMIGESIGFHPSDFTSGSDSSNTNPSRTNQVLSSSVYENPFSSRPAGRPSNSFWLNNSRPAPADQNSMDTGVSLALPSPAPETDIFDSRYSTVSDMVNTIAGTSSSTGGDQRRHSASSDSNSSDGVHETRSNHPYLNDPPSLPSPDLGGVFDAERHASSIAISDESPETIFVHPPRRPFLWDQPMSQTNPMFIDRPPPSIPIQDDATTSTTNNPNIRISYADARQRAMQTSELEALIQRQRRSELEARRISALAEEIRGMVGSSSNPIANSTNTQTQSASDLHRSSTLGRSYRNTSIEPTERRNYTRGVPSTIPNPPSTRYQGLDPSSFTPGPFRNTVQQLFNERRHTQRRPDPSPSAPPTIPPLSFELNELNDFSTSLHQRILFHQLRRTETAQATRSSARDTVDDRARRDRAITEEALRQQQQVINRRMSERIAAARGATMSDSNRRRETSDIHRFLTQQARMDASRLEDPEAPVSSQGLRHAIDLLRHDDLSTTRTQQLIERFHRDHDNTRTRVDLVSTGLSTPSTAAGPRRPDGRRYLRESIMRRESGAGDEERRSAAGIQYINQEEQRESEELAALGLSQSLSQSMRGRRGRFPRVPADVMYSLGRQARRVGTFGDYVRDEDFDESYEGLLSLSATLGDVKPKATPASILSELETGQYKDWATSESDQRCPICLDDYQPSDTVLKLNNCSHWLHKDCLQQWLQGARTCPVCRKSVYPTSQAPSSSRRSHPRQPHIHYPLFGSSNLSWRRDHPPPPGGGVDPI